MALESCKVLFLSKLKYYAIRKGNMKCEGNSRFIEHGGKPTPVLDRPIDTKIVGHAVDLMPINLLTFNTETETEE